VLGGSVGGVVGGCGEVGGCDGVAGCVDGVWLGGVGSAGCCCCCVPATTDLSGCALASVFGVFARPMLGTARNPATNIALHVDVQRFIVSPS
jgi:hypothetical protein